MKANVHEAKTHFSKLLARVEAGEEVVITKAGRPVARLVPLKEKGGWMGMDAGRVKIADDFDAPLPPEIQKAFDG